MDIVDAGALWIKSLGTCNRHIIKLEVLGSVVVVPNSLSNDVRAVKFG